MKNYWLLALPLLGGCMSANPHVPAESSQVPQDSRCTLSLRSLHSAPCYCSGPIVSDGTRLFRQANGIEILDHGTLTLATRIDEPVSSAGGLAIRGGHLLSVRQHDDIVASIYTIDGGEASERSSFAFQARDFSLATLTVSERIAIVGSDMPLELSRLIALDTSDLDDIGETWRRDVSGRLLDVAASSSNVFVMTQSSTDVGIDVLDAASGSRRTRLTFSDASDFSPRSRLALHHEKLIATTREGFVILELKEGHLVETARLLLGEASLGPISIAGSRLLIAGESSLHLLHLSDEPREIGVFTMPASANQPSHVLLSEDMAFASNGNGVSAVAIECR